MKDVAKTEARTLRPEDDNAQNIGTASTRIGIRYDQAMVLECALMRRELKKIMESRI